MNDDGELAHWRAAMDISNLRLLTLLQERARLATAIGAWKRRHGLPAADPAREAAMLARILGQPRPEGFSTQALEAVFRAVFAASRALVEAGE